MRNVSELTDEEIQEELKRTVEHGKALYTELSRRYKGQNAQEPDNV